MQNGFLRTGAMVSVLLVATQALVLPAGKPDALPGPIETDQATAAAAALQQGGEVLRMRWKLGGLLGTLAGLFIPNSGDALLTFVPQPDDQLRIQMLVTTPKRAGEYFLYGAEIDRCSGTTAEVWSSSVFRGEHEDKSQRVDSAGVIDFASAIHQLRYDPPRSARAMTIWNSGDTYPVLVEPLEPETRKIAGIRRAVRSYVIRGAKIKGKTAFEDKFFLYFARDRRATPVEILAKRGLIRVRFQLVDEIRAEH